MFVTFRFGVLNFLDRARSKKGVVGCQFLGHLRFSVLETTGVMRKLQQNRDVVTPQGNVHICLRHPPQDRGLRMRRNVLDAIRLTEDAAGRTSLPSLHVERTLYSIDSEGIHCRAI